jgi:hypothetical protein
MTTTSLHLDAALERHEIHAASCRYRRQGLICSICHELLERLIRALRARMDEAA